MIRPYKVAWFSGGTRHLAEFHDCETAKCFVTELPQFGVTGISLAYLPPDLTEAELLEGGGEPSGGDQDDQGGPVR